MVRIIIKEFTIMVVFFCVFFIASIGCFVLFLNFQEEAADFKNWQSVEGTINKSGFYITGTRPSARDRGSSFRRLKVEYFYSVKDSVYTGNRFSNNPPEQILLADTSQPPSNEMLALKQKYSADNKVTVYYNPEIPGESFLIIRTSLGTKISLWAGGITLFIAIIVLLSTILLAKKQKDWSELHFAADAHDIEKIKNLAASGMDVNCRVELGWTPLLLALFYSFRFSSDEELTAVQILAEHGARVNDRYIDGKSPLHFAQTSVGMEYLIEKGADVNGQDNEGKTPLHGLSEGMISVDGTLYAVRREVEKNISELVKVLIDHGADVNIKDKSGKSAVDYARESGSNISGLTD